MKRLLIAGLFSVLSFGMAHAAGYVVIQDGTNPGQTAGVDASGNIKTNCAVGCAGGTFNNNADAVATSATNGQSASWLYGFNGTTWDRLRVDGSKNLDINCIVGCSGGSFNNNADAVATSATNGQAAAWLYGFNGATWDRLRVDGSKNLDVNLQTAVPAGSNLIGNVGINDGTNTAKVQAASTSPALADKALTVVNSPNPSVVCPNNIAINQTASTDLHTMTNFGYICLVKLISTTQQGVTLAEGTGSNCGTGTTYIDGGSGGTNQVAANGGWVIGGAGGVAIKMNASGDHLCLIQSGSGNISGIITYADHT